MSMTAYLAQMDTIPGWFWPEDVALFNWLLQEQTRRGMQGDLAEMGVYKGKSAIMLGLARRHGETLTVCDLFGADHDASNDAENAQWYDGLVRSDFEKQYRRFLPSLPVVVQGPTSVILEHVRPAHHRFVHIDASHLYEHVAGDLRAARSMLLADGVLACDDWRTAHCPGVAAAVWEAVLNDGLRPVWVTNAKFYGTWGDPQPWREALGSWIGSRSDLLVDRDVVRGDVLLRVYSRPGPAPTPAQRIRAAVLPPALEHRLERLQSARPRRRST